MSAFTAVNFEGEIKYSHSPTYVKFAFRGTVRKSHFTEVGFSLNSVQFNYFFFISRAGKITKVVFQNVTAIKRLRQRRLSTDAVLVRSSIYFV